MGGRVTKAVLSRNRTFELEEEQQLPLTSNSEIYYKDTAVFRFNESDAVKVLWENEFFNEFKRRANDEYWKLIDCIQTAVKAKTGLGTPIFVTFHAPIDEQAPAKEIIYHFKAMPEDSDLLSQGEDDLYAYKQCLKMCYYISKVYSFEIL